MKLITLFDTSIASENVGDFIIMDAVREQLEELVTVNQIITLPTHDNFGCEGQRFLKLSEFSLVGGTNLLSSNLLKYKQWKFSMADLYYLDKAILMGVGWWQYQDKPDFYSRAVWKRVLNNNMLHSVRDSFTEKQLKSIGVNNVINTSCPTMWKLTSEHCKDIPRSIGKSVVFTLTDYNKDIEADSELIKVLQNNYEHISYWPQGSGDVSYFHDLVGNNEYKIELLSPNLSSLNQALRKPNVDYVGTRLHAGIRALQNKVRTVIIGIDNRALEKSRDFNLMVLERKKIIELDKLINSEFVTDILLPIDNINKWKSQFSEYQK
ncbi:polysaccharide pyruvyl transferase family protein [Aliivibrio fischeri]|uniref:polysaccharide pyruvyl transferase family protein n=1 Tax=Aliivibrio fischeri TaxID=668 RepID=UPI0012D896D9|nr:polysaccharide pyruvyl transferase family protein [Aliivibrio fischeri]